MNTIHLIRDVRTAMRKPLKAKYILASFFMTTLIVLFPVNIALAELDHLSIENGLVIASDGQVVGQTDDYTDYRIETEAQDGTITGLSYEPLRIVDAVVYNPGNAVCGVLDSYVADVACYWTTKEDHYYHKNANCDDGEKYEISLEASLAFDKKACPKCLLTFEPVYTGITYFDWNSGIDMWSANENDWETMQAIQNSLPQGFASESQATNTNFDAAYPDEDENIAAYPDNYAGRYRNAAGGMTYLLVNPSQSDIADFQSTYGGGVWIIAAKYSLAELNASRMQCETNCAQFLASNNSPDVVLSGSWIDVTNNVVRLEFYGADANDYITQTKFPLNVKACIVSSLPVAN